VLRKLLIPLLFALLCAPQALAQGSASTLLMPGVTYTKRVQFTTHGPVVLNVITAPQPGALYSLQPVLSNESILGREKVTDMEKRMSASATVAGVNGDLFNWNDGHPSGVLIRNGVLEHPPLAERSSVGIGADAALHIDRVSMLGYWLGIGQRLRVGLNDPPSENGYSLFTSAYGATTPAAPASAEVVLHPFPAVTANTDLVGVVASVLSPSAGRTAIPVDGAVLQARGTGASRLTTDASLGTTVTVRFTLNPNWDGMVGAVGGGPVIVKDGKAIFRANELFTTEQLSPHNPRTAVGQRADGKILLVAVDGRQPGYSAGTTNFELALAMMQLGAVSASALDAGGSTTMAFDGQLLNRPSDRGGERSVAEALVVAYTGVYVAPASDPVISPNRDGVADVASLSYKLVRPSTVEADLVGPNGVTVPIDAGERAPGTYKFTWAGTGVDAPEGKWRFAVTATDDLAQTSNADRAFALNNTLAALAVRPKALKLRKKGTRLTASFALVRPAQVTATVETAKGIVVRVLTRGAVGTGAKRLAWNGRSGSGAIAYGGSYRLHVSAANRLGRVDLYAPFTARR
jgi:exopolysaccharide biosynthesis protein/flagellar hook assembly protein FlgD